MARAAQEVDPEAVEAGLEGEVEGTFPGERGSVLRKQLAEVGESRVPARDVVERRIAGVAGIMVFRAPALSRHIVLREAADRVGEVVEQISTTEIGFVELCDEETASHDSPLES